MPWPLAIVSFGLAPVPSRSSSWLSDLLAADPERRAELPARQHYLEPVAAHQSVRRRHHGLECDAGQSSFVTTHPLGFTISVSKVVEFNGPGGCSISRPRVRA